MTWFVSLMVICMIDLQPNIHQFSDSLNCGHAILTENVCKGRIENMVKFVERNLFTPIPRVDSLTELNALLKERCKESNCLRTSTGRTGVFTALAKAYARMLSNRTGENQPLCHGAV